MRLNVISAIVGSSLIVIGSGLYLHVQNAQPVINKTFPTKSYHSSVISPPPSSNTADTNSTAAVSSEPGMPDELSLPSLSLKLPVVPGYYNSETKTWNVGLSQVQYDVSTPKPNTVGGATFFYGHYRRAVFAYLHDIKANAQAIVTTNSGQTFYYQLASIRTTSPNDDSVFKYSGPPVLVIQTCTGAFFQYRQFYTFNLVKVT